ncbi:MAG: hypothetical protein F7B20_04830 [Aeropyrum sp.]|nr:hypothetical protein [Aeropyrum sp.]MCE4616761.1 hypothetical protein [Aeropyrum sp.]
MTQDITSGDVITAVVLQAGGGAVLGFAAGYAVKKAVKVLLIVLGAFMMGLLGLSYYGIITVNWGKLALYIERAISGSQAAAASLKSYVLASVPFAGSFMLGFALGFKYG